MIEFKDLDGDDVNTLLHDLLAFADSEETPDALD